AALAALTGPKDSVVTMAEEFTKRREYIYEEVNKIPGLSLVKPEGAFYAFIKVSDLYTDEMNDSFKFTEFLLEKANVAVVPGGAFGKEGDEYIRFSYASSMEDIKEGLERIKKALE
ncbi:aminotransferase class I/II-fold pyridoxal phosphate-dependent enzyme, partial [Patescibacteria group bacterium]|nr:aminotransferase class I/II-fold pyridoxal phosphate-dependent enzyme [Patescibacteria group bacterium]